MPVSAPDERLLVAGLELELSAVQMKGIAGDVAVNRLRGTAVS